MGYSKNPFGTNRKSRNTTKSLINLGFGIISGLSKANKAEKKEAEKQRKARERQLIIEEKARIKAQKEAEKNAIKLATQIERNNEKLRKEKLKADQLKKEAEYILKGYIKKNISFFSKYMALSILDDDLKFEIETKLKKGERFIFVHSLKLEELKSRYRDSTSSKLKNHVESKEWHNAHPGINKNEDYPDYI